VTLDRVRTGKRFRIEGVRARGEIRQRLVDMRFIRGAEGSVVRAAPLRDPIEIRLSGYRVSLRREEARLLSVRVLP
jgi:Fe2+ transport system protein FeoA